MATNEQMNQEQFRALARMGSTELGQLASMALMVVAIKTERDYVEVIHELADLVEEKHDPAEQEDLRRAVEAVMLDEPEPADDEPPARHVEAEREGHEPPELIYAIRLKASVWDLDPDQALDLIEKAAQDARDHLLMAFETNRDQVRADFPDRFV